MKVGLIVDMRKPDPNHVHSEKCWRDTEGPVIWWLCGQEPMFTPNPLTNQEKVIQYPHE